MRPVAFRSRYLRVVLVAACFSDTQRQVPQTGTKSTNDCLNFCTLCASLWQNPLLFTSFAAGAGAIGNCVERLRAKRERFLNRRIKSFRSSDSFKLHERRDLLVQRQSGEFCTKLCFVIVRLSARLWSRRNHHYHFTVVLDLRLTCES